MSETTYKAMVRQVVREGPHGPYLIARCMELGSVTLSLDQEAWEDDVQPEPGMYVILSRVRRKRAGWRAFRGRLVNPTDEKNSKEQGE